MEALETALRRDDGQPAAEREQYGERLNTVVSMVCPACLRTQRMTVHPGHRLYQLCKHAFELPPLPQQRLSPSRRQPRTPRKERR